MRVLSAFELVRVWEQGLARAPAQRALNLLAAACPNTPREVLAQLSIGERDARLLTLREWTFGPQLVSLATCPDCGERLELSFSVSDIRVGDVCVTPSAAPLPGPGDEAGNETLSLSTGGYEVRFRLPNCLDLVVIADQKEVATTRGLLLERCILDAQQNGKETALDQLPADVIDAVMEHMTEADPQADVQLDLSCPLCDHRWQAAFDIVSFFWSEINVWAHRVLREVHILASAYGWREADILAMSPWRRQFYL